MYIAPNCSSEWGTLVTEHNSFKKSRTSGLEDRAKNIINQSNYSAYHPLVGRVMYHSFHTDIKSIASA